MANDREDAAPRCPPGDLKVRVQEFFEHVARLELPDGTKFRTATTRRPSHVVALTTMGLQESSYSGWKNGNPSRDETFNRRLLDGLNGDFEWVAAEAKKTAVATWTAARGDPSAAALIANLLEGLAAHGHGLAGADSAERRAATRSAPPTTPAGVRRWDAGAQAPRWSNPWTQRTIAPWAQALADGKDRVVYIYGARGSGKNVLTTALGLDLTSRREDVARRIHLNVRDLAAHFRSHRDAEKVRAEILHEIAGGATAASSNPNFDDEMAHALDLVTEGPIYLFIENADACLRILEGEMREAAVDATAPLFNFLRPVAQETGKPVLDRVSVILDGARPLADLAKAYPASPLNDGRQHVLRRLSEQDCAELGRLAGLNQALDLARLFALTAGHRSLVWAVLKTVGTGPVPGTPAELADLESVRKALDKLRDELTSQPRLAEAFAKVGRGERIDSDSRARLRDAMYIDDADPPACGCPLLLTLLKSET